MTVIYETYTRGRVGVLFGLSTGQLVTLGLTALPILAAFNASAWLTVAALTLVWVVVAFLVIVRIRGRSTLGWLTAATLFHIGRITGTSRFRSKIASGTPTEPDAMDMPGAMQDIEIHDGPPSRITGSRLALVQNHTHRDWAVVARVIHPGLGARSDTERTQLGKGLANLLEGCAQGELVCEVQMMIRTVPEDGAEYAEWVKTHEVPGLVPAADQVNQVMRTVLAKASVRTEAFVTIIVPEARLAKDAKQAGGGMIGRGKVLSQVADEITGLLTGMGVTRVDWLSSESLAVAVRTGFAPGDRAAIIDLVTQGETAPIRWSVAGPSGADPAQRYYSHDAWNSSAVAIGLPQKGTVMGALALVLQSPATGVRRSLCVVYPIIPASKAAGAVRSRRFAHETAESLRARAGISSDAADRRDRRRTSQADEQMATGAAWCSPYAFACVTSPKTMSASEQLAGLMASVRRSGFDAMPTDLSHDTGMVMASVPVGVSLRKVEK